MLNMLRSLGVVRGLKPMQLEHATVLLSNPATTQTTATRAIYVKGGPALIMNEEEEEVCASF